MSYLQPLLQCLAGRFLVLVESVAVDVQRGGRLAVPQQPRHRGHIRPTRNQKAGVAVPLWHNKDKSENP